MWTSLPQLAPTTHADPNHDISPHDFESTTNVKSSHNPYDSKRAAEDFG
jgi:hypothetical protein